MKWVSLRAAFFHQVFSTSKQIQSEYLSVQVWRPCYMYMVLLSASEADPYLASNAGFSCAWTVYKGGWQKITSNFLLQSQYASTFLTNLFLSMARYSSGSGSKVPWDHLWPQTLQSKQPSPIRNFAPTSRQHKITKEQQYHTADRRGHKSKNKISRKTRYSAQNICSCHSCSFSLGF